MDLFFIGIISAMIIAINIPGVGIRTRCLALSGTALTTNSRDSQFLCSLLVFDYHRRLETSSVQTCVDRFLDVQICTHAQGDATSKQDGCIKQKYSTTRTFYDGAYPASRFSHELDHEIDYGELSVRKPQMGIVTARLIYVTYLVTAATGQTFSTSYETAILPALYGKGACFDVWYTFLGDPSVLRPCEWDHDNAQSQYHGV